MVSFYELDQRNRAARRQRSGTGLIPLGPPPPAPIAAPADRPGLGQQFLQSAIRSGSLGFLGQELDPARSPLEGGVRLAGAALGTLPYFFGGEALLGARFLAPAVGRILSRQAAQFLPRIAPQTATRIGQNIGRYAGGGLTFGGASAAADIVRGEPVGQALAQIPQETALAIGGGLVGDLLGAGFQALRGSRAAAQTVDEIIPLSEPRTAGLLPERAESLQVPREPQIERLLPEAPRGYPDQQDLDRYLPTPDRNVVDISEQGIGTSPRPSTEPTELPATPAPIERSVLQQRPVAGIAREMEILGRESPLNPRRPLEAPETRAQAAISRAFNAVDTVLRRMGPTGQRLAGAFKTMQRQEDMLVGQYHNKAGRVFTRLSPAEQQEVRAVIEGRAKPSSQKIARIAQDVQQYLSNSARLIEEVGLPVYVRRIERSADPSVPDRVVLERRPFQRVANYFPRMYDWSKIESATEPYGFKREVLEFMVESRQARSVAQAAKILNQIRSRGSLQEPIAPFQYQRVIRLPDQYRLSPAKELTMYAQSLAHQVAMRRVFGPELNGLRTMLSQFTDAEDARYARKVAETVLGIGERDNLSNYISGLLRNFNTIRAMTLAVIPNTSQSVITATRTDIESTLKAIAKVARDIGSVEELAAEWGVVSDAVVSAQRFADAEGLSPLGDLASQVLQKTGFSAVERFNQLVAFTAGQEWAKKLFRALQTGPESGPQWLRGLTGKGTGNIRRVFAEAGVDIDEALRRGFLSEEDLGKMGYWVNQNTQYPKSKLDIPLWTESPLGKILFQFQRFMYQQTRTLRRVYWDDLQRYIRTQGREGAVAPALIIPTLGAMAGLPIGMIRDFISGRERPEGFLETYIDALAWVGAYGLFEEVLRLAQGNPDRAVVSLLGPSGTVGREVLGVIQGLGRATIGGEPAEGLREATRSALRAVLPTPLGYPLARGELPFGIESPLLQRTLQPQHYDPTGRLAATRAYNEEMQKIEDAYVKWQVSGNVEPFMKATRDAAEKGLAITNTDINRRMSSTTVQLRIAQERLKRAKGSERQLIQRQIQILEQMLEQERLSRVPQAAQSLLTQDVAQ